MTESKKLTYRKEKNISGEILIAHVKLADDCRNGHQDFSVTGEIYKAGKPRTDRNLIACGAMGDTIKQLMPELGIFCDLHLCDYLGAPMHAVANMHYHMTNEFNAGDPIDSAAHREKFCEYYRISGDQFDKLAGAHSRVHFAMMLAALGIPEQWKRQADKAIALLEELTGKKFAVDSERQNLQMPTADEIDAERDRIEAGFYSVEAIAERKRAALAEKRAAIIARAERDKAKIDRKLAVNLAIFDAGGPRGLEHTIYYDHKETVRFNWRKYGKELTADEIEQIKQKAKLPSGVTFE